MAEITLSELAEMLSQTNVLKLRIEQTKSRIGGKEHTIGENEKAIKRAESLAENNKKLSDEIEIEKVQISNDEVEMRRMLKVLNDNGISVAEKLTGTTIVRS